jgi:hypothetical protein
MILTCLYRVVLSWSRLFGQSGGFAKVYSVV